MVNMGCQINVYKEAHVKVEGTGVNENIVLARETSNESHYVVSSQFSVKTTELFTYLHFVSKL